MDPLSALSLAANVLQFIEFTGGLLSTSVEVYKSTTGASNASIALEEIREQLSSLSDRLLAGTANIRSSASELALKSIAASCSADCVRILTVLNDLKVQDGSHRAWKSLRAALKLAWKGEQEIERLTNRLKDRQSMMTLHICAISNEWLQKSHQQLRGLEKQNKILQLQYLDKLNEISSQIRDVKLRINKSKISGLDSTFSASDLDDLTTRVSLVSVAERDITKEQAILSSLDFDYRPARHENIPEAHARTFSWIFEAPDSKVKRANSFVTWLRESGGVFWISGKPGSGKSTLMKFLASHTQTRDAVQSWASPGKVVIASHFFWSTGVSMQKSALGLFRSLLYEIFRQCPELIAEACPSRWEANDLSHAAGRNWTLKELVECFQAIKANETSPAKFCFFVDGLDEFDGDYVEISQFLTEIAESPRIKLCVASRPLNEFQDQFGVNKSSMISIHELTRKDILNYARSRLQEHPRWSILGLDVQAAESFLAKIVDMAHGVFLWVTLVTQSLRSGLTNDDTMEDLNARLDSLPRSLEAFYQQMLDSVDPIYHRKSAELLQIQKARLDSSPGWPTPWAIVLLHEREYADPDYAVTMSRKKFKCDEVTSYCEQATRRLNAKCRGLLEIRRDALEYIHRTASDYLNKPELVDYIRSRSGEGYNAHLSLLRGYVACLKMGVPRTMGTRKGTREGDKDMCAEAVFSISLHFAKIARRGGIDDAVIFKLVNCLDEIAMSMVHREKGGDLFERLDIWSTPIASLCGPLRFSPFVNSLIWTESADYAATKLSGDADYFRRVPRPALWYFVVRRQTLTWDPSATKFLHLLLQNGHDPNETFMHEPEYHRNILEPQGINYWKGDLYKSYQTIWYPEVGSYGPPEMTSAWFGFLTTCGICGHFGFRRRVESELYRHCEVSNSPFGYPRLACFNTALKWGVYSSLLQYGANPNAHPTPFTTAWADFVRFAIKYPSEVWEASRYLETLDNFFKYGADLGASTVGFTLLPGDDSSHMPLRMITGWDTFCESLEDLTGSETEKELKFISQITIKMIKQAISTRWPLGRLHSVIKKVFPEKLYQPMLDLISESQAREDPNARGKRQLEDTNTEVESKRLKPDSIDVTMT
ncbi:hypothetical protein F5Y13DRAFT_197274 [Hypoxylon sp. FL1857]|nr:hypothetical protein F5Y13DRAFT_197274 [Hypoxylon sp. FL1857]